MEEGELKKRIYEEGGNMLEDIPCVIEIDREKFDMIIDDAKKEFYEWLSRMMPDPRIGKFVIVVQGDISQEQLQLLTQWIWNGSRLILKWLGEPVGR